MLSLSDGQLRDWVREFERRRYDVHGWRNHRNLWRKTLGLDTTRDKHVLDYGCGFGIEALQFARGGNQITLWDLTEDGLRAAQHVLAVHGYACLVASGYPLPEADIFYANGVLHHFPDGMRVLNEAPAQEARVMVYSDRAWAAHGGTGFWRAMDEVGGYADWYSADKLAVAVPDWKLMSWDYITSNGWYLTATLERR